MRKNKNKIRHSINKKEIKVDLIPVYVSEDEFQDKRKIVQNVIARMYASIHKRGRPQNDLEEDFSHAA